MLSMTGFGASRLTAAKHVVSIEVRSLNHRYCDINVRLPRLFQHLEPFITKKVRETVHRGRLEVVFSLADGAAGGLPALNLPLAKRYFEMLTLLGRRLGTLGPKEKPDLSLLVGFRDIFQENEAAPAAEALWKEVQPGIEKALRALTVMRKKEGEAVEKHLLASWKRLGELRERIVAESKGLPARLQETLRAAVRELLDNQTAALDEGRLAQEVAYLAERSDIGEELNRLQAHLDHLREIFRETAPIGRRLDFLLQEFNREINTIGSKTTELGITQTVVEFKAELERMREQVQNIE